MAKAPLSTQDRLKQLRESFLEIENQLSSPEISGDAKRMRELGRDHQRLKVTIGLASSLAEAETRLEEAKEMLRTEKDSEMRELAELDIEEAESVIPGLAEELQIRLLPPDPNDDKNLLLEIRAGTGGEEAALFAADLLRMYTRYAETQGWTMELLSSTGTDSGGLKDICVSVKGDGAYSQLKFESGGHRVQRVPATETQGRIHTSAATVAVLPEAEETDLEIRSDDLRIDTYRASGAGGQHVNKTDSAIRITHLPTNVVVQCQDERSQIKNKAKAMTMLRSKLLEAKIRAEQEAISSQRKALVGSGDRSERIRTYNFPQNRMTDHRINLTLYNLDKLMEGEMGDLINALRKTEMDQKMEEMS